MANKRRKSGDGGFCKNGNGWDFRIVVGRNEQGKPKFKSFYGKTKNEAEKRYKEWKKAQGENTDKELEDWTVGEWAEFWFKDYVVGKVKITTHSDDRSIL